jgi:branched-chain amino acid transport system permease protein
LLLHEREWRVLTSIIAGLAAGGAYALLAVCLVFTYRLVAVVNFTGASIGATGTFVMVMLHEWGYGLAISVLLGLLSGIVTAMLFGALIMRWFAGAAAQTKAAVTVALLVGMIALGLRLTGGQHPRAFPDLLPGAAFEVAGVIITKAAVLSITLALIFMVAATLFLNKTRIGLQLRALSERPMTAELTGIPTLRLSIGVWAVAGFATTLAMMIIAPQRAPNFLTFSMLVVPAFAAALIGSFRSFNLAFVGGITLGLLEGFAAGLSALAQYRSAVPFMIILAVLLWSQRKARWDEAR